MLLSTCRRATLWCLVPLALAAQEPGAPCVFAGTVIDSVTGQPLAKATASIRSRDDSKPSYFTSTGADGAFRFAAISAGDYTLQVSASGYRAAVAMSLKPGQATSWLHLTAGQTITDAVAALDPPAVVSGRVTDADGEPIGHAQIQALERVWHRGEADIQIEAQFEADDHGEYRMTVFPGQYFLRAGPRSENSLPDLFSSGPGKPAMMVASIVYPGLPDVDGATEFDLHGGQQLEGIDFKLPEVRAYRVRGSAGGGPDLHMPLSLTLTQRDGIQSWGAGLDPKGNFNFPGVPAGIYWLSLTSRGGGAFARAPVEVTDRDVEGIAVRANPPFILTGRVRFDDSEPHHLGQPQLFLTLMDWSFRNYGMSSRVTPDGRFEFASVPPAEAALTLAENPDFYLESISYNHREAPGGKLDFRAGVAGNLEVVLGSGTGQIAGTIRWPDGAAGAAPHPASEIAAVLVRSDGVTGNTGVRVVGIDQEGHFQFRHLGPGRYFVWAVTHFDEGHWQNMDFVTEMQSHGVAVDLPHKGSVTVEISEVLQ